MADVSHANSRDHENPRKTSLRSRSSSHNRRAWDYRRHSNRISSRRSSRKGYVKDSKRLRERLVY